MNNRLLNINGKSKELLAKALELAFNQEWGQSKVQAFFKCEEKGLLLLAWPENESTNLIAPMTHAEVLDSVWTYLQTEDAKLVKKEHWESDYDHDGSNSEGWRVYTEDWGHVGNYRGVICAIKHVYLWYGK